MRGTTEYERPEDARIVLGLLESIERDGDSSQRRLASELGIALGLVNAYIKRCVKKGLMKVGDAPARRYAYYLTPQGFAEKSRLTVEYLSYSFGFFREAKSDCASVLEAARARSITRIALAGVSDLAEIAAICSLESKVEIVAVVDARCAQERFVGCPVVATFDGIDLSIDGVIVTDLQNTSETFDAAVAHYGADRVMIPALLAKRLLKWKETNI
jgi:DNA-binding MarR family transcriptional regulator